SQGAQGAAGAQGVQGTQGPQGVHGPDWDGTEQGLGSVSGSVELPFDLYRNVSASIGGNTDFTFDAAAATGHYQLRVTLSGAFTVTFPNTTLWPNGVIYTPSGSGETDIINF